MFKDLFSQKSGQSQDISGDIRVVGDRLSGKTTYLAALARWPKAGSSSLVEAVTASNKNGEDLLEMAQNILEQGLELGPMPLPDEVLEMKNYGLRIVLRKKSGAQNALVNLDLICKDYAGEFFSDLLNQSGVQLQEYIQDCSLATGMMLMIDGTAHRQDFQYVRGIDKLMLALDRADDQARKRRIAMVLTKCELADLWINRHRPRWLASARFPKLCEKLNSWQRFGAWEVDYFSVSAFGVLGNRFPRPNYKQIARNRQAVAAVLEDPKRWRPFGLVSPIYWLCTGVRNTELDKDGNSRI
ncbi:MAG: hypothetical protein EBE86_024390 [Hormoscilla sp. GUM202]|nr:hypothetical protein [Hormoscilla sp. GUM202]